MDAARQDGRIGGCRPNLSPQQRAEIKRMVSKGGKTAADAVRLFKIQPHRPPPPCFSVGSRYLDTERRVSDSLRIQLLYLGPHFQTHYKLSIGSGGEGGAHAGG
jgi:hypothetical protein